MDLEYGVIRYLPKKLSIPLFFIPKQRIKQHYADEFKSYLTKKIEFYAKPRPYDDSDDENATLAPAKPEKTVMRITPYKTPTCKPRQVEVIRGLAAALPWQLAPNIYEVSKVPFEKRKGIGGAYWRKRVVPKTTEKRVNRIGFYDLPRETERMQKVCHKHKGILVNNARERRPSSRNMLFDAATCFRDPTEPSPVSYNTFLKKRPIKKSPPVEEPCEFHRRSSVPKKRNACHRRHTSFEPAPGRYEIRYPKVCCCLANLIYQPELQILIERQKRLKFRRLPYIKIKSRLYCTPDWRHVQGHGFRYLFGRVKPTTQTVTEEKPGKVRKVKEIKVNYLDARYIHTINDPLRRPISIRYDSVTTEEPHIEFNCLRKPTIRKTLRVNKKVVFGSSQGRYKDGPTHPPILTIKQMEAIKNKLPLELQLRDHPIMDKSPDDIKSKFQIIPKRYSNVPVVQRLKDFKFSPLPEAKILVNKQDVSYDADADNGYYFKAVKAENYFKQKADDDSVISDSSDD